MEASVETARVELDQADQDLLTAESETAGAQALIDDAQTAVDAAQSGVDSVQAEIDTAQQSFDAERAAVETLVDELSAEQLFALNRSLNNAVSSDLLLNFGAEQLAAIIDGDFNKQQIYFLTKAFESEAKFLRLAEETGNDRFLAKAETEKAKFLSRIERFGADRAQGALEPASRPGPTNSGTPANRRQISGAPVITTTLGVINIDVSSVTNGFIQSETRSGGRTRASANNSDSGQGRAEEGNKNGSIRELYALVIECLERQEVGLWTARVSRCGFRRRAG